MLSVTTMPRLTESPASFANAALGRMPTAITTSVAGIAVPSSSSMPSTRVSPMMRLVLALVMILMPRLFEFTRQQISGGGIELALHQGRHQMDHGDIHAALLEARRGFEAKQSATDDDSLAA